MFCDESFSCTQRYLVLHEHEFCAVVNKKCPPVNFIAVGLLPFVWGKWPVLDDTYWSKDTFWPTVRSFLLRAMSCDGFCVTLVNSGVWRVKWAILNEAQRGMWHIEDALFLVKIMRFSELEEHNYAWICWNPQCTNFQWGFDYVPQWESLKHLDFVKASKAMLTAATISEETEVAIGRLLPLWQSK